MPGPVPLNSTPLRHPPGESLRPPAAAGRRAPGGPTDPGLQAACEDLEALFIHHLLSEMRKTVSKSGLIDGGRSEEIYTSLMDSELAKEMARSGGLGLSAILQEQLGDLTGKRRVTPRPR
jgi:flagellar protein FlgJ